MISKTRAQHLLRITALLQVTFFGYVLLLQGHLVHRPSFSARIYIGLGVLFTLAAQWYARRVLEKWKKVDGGVPKTAT
jgi:hypothetical protein